MIQKKLTLLRLNQPEQNYTIIPKIINESLNI
jgi:hypothetical protein